MRFDSGNVAGGHIVKNRRRKMSVNCSVPEPVLVRPQACGAGLGAGAPEKRSRDTKALLELRRNLGREARASGRCIVQEEFEVPPHSRVDRGIFGSRPKVACQLSGVEIKGAGGT